MVMSIRAISGRCFSSIAIAAEPFSASATKVKRGSSLSMERKDICTAALSSTMATRMQGSIGHHGSGPRNEYPPVLLSIVSFNKIFYLLCYSKSTWRTGWAQSWGWRYHKFIPNKFF